MKHETVHEMPFLCIYKFKGYNLMKIVLFKAYLVLLHIRRKDKETHKVTPPFFFLLSLRFTGPNLYNNEQKRKRT